jgi:hypothetical protein
MAQEHSFATSSPACSGAMAVATLGFAPIFLGWVDLSGLPLLAAWLIVGADTGWFTIDDLKTSKAIIGYLMIVIGWIGVYFSGATVCNTVYGKAIFPVPKPLIK